MNEKLFQFIWQFQYFNRSQLLTAASEIIEIINPGKLNKNQGPDFIDAKIRISETILAGSVELHIKSSDWQKHGHGDDAHYKNVILHVVFENDLLDESSIPVLELQPYISSLLLERYHQMMNAQTFNPCGDSISGVKEIVWASWKERLLVERLSRKSKYILQLLENSNHHWEEAFWWLIASNFGIKVNADAFEAIARSIPVSLLAKHKSHIQQIEALLFGQAQLLNQEFTDEYPKLLQREYRFLAGKYHLKPVHASLFFLRMRPCNFPTIRLAQLAVLIHSSNHLF
ncbi:MAG TPA: DUF2851 family protein, partial [Flavisolibacter sp.]|nr:DUF2851 family protein [Flavisolibacter sp.]